MRIRIFVYIRFQEAKVVKNDRLKQNESFFCFIIKTS